MKRMAIAVMTAALVATAGLSAQQTSFAGKWTQVVDPAAAPPAGGGGGGGGRGMGGGGGLCGPACTITQDATTLTVMRTTPAGEIKTAYRLDGGESKNSVTMGPQSVETTSVAKWDGAKLLVTTKQNMGETPVEFKYTVSVVGDELVIERTGGREGMPAQTLKYKKG